jgi:hypothetical protein
MKRDLDLIRKMILAIEDHPSGWAPQDLAFEGYTPEQVGYHAYLLVNAGLARGDYAERVGSDGPEGYISSLTWAGHEFAAAARDESRWKKAMEIVKEKGGNITVTVLAQLLLNLTKVTFGLP